MEIAIAGDIYISDAFKDKRLIDNSIIELFSGVDYKIVNLEAPITIDNPKNKLLKTGPNIRMSIDTIVPFLTQLKINIVTLANNHILDYGESGLRNTFDTLSRININYVGAGDNISQARKHITLKKDDVQIAILNFCENEWSIAKEKSAGANPLNTIDNANQIKEAKLNNDKVICIIHGGHEYYNLPSPNTRKLYQFYVDNGADIIIGHHTHCIGGFEIYKSAPIIYSLGNFLFTYKSENDEWYNGLITKLKLTKTDPITFNLIPIRQSKNNYYLSIISGNSQKHIFEKINYLNNIISDSVLLQDHWDKWIKQNKKRILNYLSYNNGINNILIHRILYKLGLSELFLNKHYFKLILNILRCESHFEALLYSLNQTLNKSNDSNSL